MSVIDVYDLRQYIQVTFGYGDGMSLSNYPVNSTDIRVLRGVENHVDVRVRDIDRKPVDIAPGGTIDMVVNSDTKTLLTKRLVAVNAARGHYLASFDPQDLPEETDLLTYYLVMTDASGNEHLLFTDRSRMAKGTFLVANGPDPAPPPTIELSFSDFLAQTNDYVSSSYASEGARHTVVVETEFFTGSVVVEGTLDDSPTITADRWFEIERRTFVDASGRDIFNVEGNFSFVRFRVAMGIDNDGEMTRILYR